MKVKENSTFSISDPLHLKLLTHLRLDFSQCQPYVFLRQCQPYVFLGY